MSRKHLQRYVTEFVWRRNHQREGLLEKDGRGVPGLIGKSLPYKKLIG